MGQRPKWYLTELNDGIQWLTDGDFGMNPDAAPKLLEALARALTTTEEIERVSGQRHYNPGTLQVMADAVKLAKGTNMDKEIPHPSRVTPTVGPYWVTGIQPEPCKDCDGEGEFQIGEGPSDPLGNASSIYKDCDRCQGTGEAS